MARPPPPQGGGRAGAHESPPAIARELKGPRFLRLTRARLTLMVSTLRRRKKGRDTVQGVPSRFIKEMKLDEARAVVDPKEKLKALRAAAAERAAKAAT